MNLLVFIFDIHSRMSYQGGKSKNAGHILRVINNELFDGWDHIEPFCGYCHILRRVTNKKSYTASDNNALLVCLLNGIQQNNTPIPHMTREEYSALKKSDEITVKRATACFAASFNGKAFGGYVNTYTRKSGRVDDIQESRRNYYRNLQLNEQFMPTSFTCCDYRMIQPRTKLLIYLDPPYAGTIDYGKTFDSKSFWNTVREWSKITVVLVSEYEAPDEFECIASQEKKCCISGGNKQTTRIENLFIHNPLLEHYPALARSV